MSKVLRRVLLAAALVATLPMTTVAQEESATPEGIDWHLTSFSLDGPALVPWTVDPTLRLDDGTATGWTGCNQFTGSYALDDDSLTFDDTLAMTRMACQGAAGIVEPAYVAALAEVSGWTIDGGTLRLSNADDTAVLEFEQALIALTPTDVSELESRLGDLQAQLDRAGERIDNIRIGTLRERIRTLESQVAALEAQAAASSSSSGSGSGSSFTAAEKVLLKAIPQKVKRTCKPMRSGLPSGTAAAVACDGSRQAVAEQAYYLMEWSDAVATMRSVAGSKGVPNRLPRCHNQRAGWIHYGTNLGAEACWAENGTANYRLVTNATNCKQLDVGGTRLRQPAIYLAMEGTSNRMEPVRAAGLAYTDAGYLLMNFEAGRSIEAKGQPNSPGCNARIAAAGGL